jgi:hypothetical protein
MSLREESETGQFSEIQRTDELRGFVVRKALMSNSVTSHRLRPRANRMDPRFSVERFKPFMNPA